MLVQIISNRLNSAKTAWDRRASAFHSRSESSKCAPHGSAFFARSVIKIPDQGRQAIPVYLFVACGGQSPSKTPTFRDRRAAYQLQIPHCPTPQKYLEDISKPAATF